MKLRALLSNVNKSIELSVMNGGMNSVPFIQSAICNPQFLEAPPE